MSEFIDTERRGRVLVLTIHRPDQLNALTHDMYSSLAQGLEDLSSDDTLRAAVITGRGEYFTAGNDLGDFARGMPEGKPPVMRFLEALRDAPKPVIAAVNGPAIGVGLTLLLHCDLSYASESATFRAPFPQVGVVPEAGSSLLLPQAVGMAWANDILIAGRTLNAEEAVAIGLVSRVFADDELLPETLTIAAGVAGQAPNATRKSKALIRGGREALVEQMKREGKDFFEQLQSAEFRESVAAIREKRAPNFD
ncbi:MAG: enoyl-CoA hydratase-related protein [Acidobacteriota bacterium]